MADTIMITENALSKEECEQIINAVPKSLKYAYKKENHADRQDIQLGGEMVLAEVLIEGALAQKSGYEDETWDRPGLNSLRVRLSNILGSAINVYAEKFPIIKDFHLSQCQISWEGWKVQKTKVGQGFHKWHHEDAVYRKRFLVWTIFLNDVVEGGETEFLYQNLRIPAKQGSLCLFPSDWTHLHRGNPPISNDKYIMTGWYTYHYIEN
jgi:hypothetical protein